MYAKVPYALAFVVEKYEKTPTYSASKLFLTWSRDSQKKI